MKFNKLNEGLDQSRQKKLEELNLGGMAAKAAGAVKRGVQGVGNVKNQFKNQMDVENTAATAKKAHDQSNETNINLRIDAYYKKLTTLAQQFIKAMNAKNVESAGQLEKQYNEVLGKMKQMLKPEVSGSKQEKSANKEAEWDAKFAAMEGLVEQLLFEIDAKAGYNSKMDTFDKISQIMAGADPNNPEDYVAQIQKTLSSAESSGSESAGEGGDFAFPQKWDGAAALMNKIKNHKKDDPTNPNFLDDLKAKKVTPEYLEKWRAYIPYEKGSPDSPNQAYSDAISLLDDAKRALGGEDGGAEPAPDFDSKKDTVDVTEKNKEKNMSPEEKEEMMQLKKYSSPFAQQAKLLNQQVKDTMNKSPESVQKLLNATAISLKKSGNVDPKVIQTLKSPVGPQIFRTIISIAAKESEMEAQPTQQEEAILSSFEFMLFEDQIVKEAIKVSKQIIL